MSAFSFTDRPIDVAALRASLEDPASGGYTSFEGWVRNHNEGHAVTRLEYEAFEALAIKEGERIVAEAIARFGVEHAACVHRVGSLGIGEMAVWVGVSSGHRGEAFAACRYIIDEVKHRVPIWKKEHYVNGDSGWVNCERCATHAHDHDRLRLLQHGHEHHGGHEHHHDAHEPASVLRPDYSRQTSLREVGAAGQARLAAARVLVVGAGGLGVPVLGYLAGAGVGTLGVADGDVLEASNLHRQTMYSLSDVGAPKAGLAARRLRGLNPDIDIKVHGERVTAGNVLQLLANYDVVVECSDNFATKFLVNDAAVQLRKPAVFASIYQYEGQLQVYRPDRDSACLRCLWPEATRDGLVGNCSEAGVLGPVPGVLGSLQALETLKLLLDLPGQLDGEMMLVDLIGLTQQKLRTPRRADCCGPDSRRAVIAAPAASAVSIERRFPSLEEAVKAGYCIVDIRDEPEISAQPIRARALQIPMNTLLGDPRALERTTRYLLVCARGQRSRALAGHLREQGFAEVYSLPGGLSKLEQPEPDYSAR